MKPDEISTVAGIRITHPERILFPELGLSKRELVDYYRAVGERMLLHVAHRPLALLRCPRGRNEKCFYQKHYSDAIEGPIDPVELVEQSGSKATYMSIREVAGLIQLVQLGTLEFHPWGSRVDRLDRPDRLIFDLDPGSGVEWRRLPQAARLIRDRLDQHGLVCFVKTSGGKGLHVVAPLERRAGWEEVRSFAQGVARQLAEEAPDEYVAVASKARRQGRIFIDYLRNARGATNVAPFSTRARPGAPVSLPIDWQELDTLHSAGDFHLANMRDWLASRDFNPWQGFFDHRQSITNPMLAAVEG